MSNYKLEPEEHRESDTGRSDTGVMYPNEVSRVNPNSIRLSKKGPGHRHRERSQCGHRRRQPSSSMERSLTENQTAWHFDQVLPGCRILTKHFWCLHHPGHDGCSVREVLGSEGSLTGWKALPFHGDHWSCLWAQGWSQLTWKGSRVSLPPLFLKVHRVKHWKVVLLSATETSWAWG